MNRRRRHIAKTKIKALSVVDLVDGCERFGAEFYFTGAGSLRVRHLEKLPADLRNQFYEADGAQLVAWLKSRKKHAAVREESIK